jgi:DinB superfamily
VTALEGVLAEFEQIRRAFEGSVRRAPDAALRYKPAGEDYALGGLVVHVADVLRKYAGLLDAMQRTNWQPMHAPQHETSAEDASVIREGVGGDARAAVLEQMRAAHTALVDAVRVAGAESFSRKAAVTFSGSSEPYPTSPADVVGWVHDHYNEHTQQVAELVSAWAAATR